MCGVQLWETLTHTYATRDRNKYKCISEINYVNLFSGSSQVHVTLNATLTATTNANA